MSKATVQNVIDEGFNAAMFGGDAAFATAGTGTVAKLLARAGNWAAMKVTQANYDAAATGYAFDCLADAEKYFASYQLWIRRIGFLDAGATIGLEADKKSLLLAQARTNAEQAQCDANWWLSEAMRAFGMDVQADMYGTGISTGIVETGAFPQHVPAALNYGGAQ